MLTSPGLRKTVFGPDHEVTYHVASDDLDITFYLIGLDPIFGKAEYSARATIRARGKHLNEEVFIDHGGFDIAHLYRNDGGSYLIAGSMGSFGFETEPLRRMERVPSYLGSRNATEYVCDRRGSGSIENCRLRLQASGSLECQPSTLFMGWCYLGTFARYPEGFGFRKLAVDGLEDPGALSNQEFNDLTRP